MQNETLNIEAYIVDFSDSRTGIGMHKGMTGTTQYQAPEVTLGM